LVPEVPDTADFTVFGKNKDQRSLSFFLQLRGPAAALSRKFLHDLTAARRSKSFFFVICVIRIFTMKIEKFQLRGNSSVCAGEFQLLRGRAHAQLRGNIDKDTCFRKKMNQYHQAQLQQYQRGYTLQVYFRFQISTFKV
jgi:hypothetical protein